MVFIRYLDLRLWALLPAVRYQVCAKLQQSVSNSGTPAFLDLSAWSAGCPHAPWNNGKCKVFVVLKVMLPVKCSQMDSKWLTLDFEVWKMRHNNICKKIVEGCYPLTVCISRSLLPNYLPATVMIDFSALWTAYAALLCLDKRLQGLSILRLLCTILRLSKVNIFLPQTSIT